MWEFLFKYPAEMFGRGTITLSAPGWAYLAVVLASGIAIPTLLRYRRATSGLGAAHGAVLSATRTAIVALVALALFEPILTVTNTISQRRVVAILLDDSVSMNVADQDGESRAAFVARAFHPERGAVTQALARRFEPRLFRFAGDSSPLSDARTMTFTGANTDVGRALDGVREAVDPQSLAALVVVSDGAVTRPTSLAARLSAYRAADVPVTTVAVGSARFARDLEVRAVGMPRRTLQGSAVFADVVVAHRGFGGETVKLMVEADGELVAVEELRLDPDQSARTVRIRFTAGEPGVRRMRFQVIPSADEITVENNVHDAILEIDGTRQRILYFEGEPRFELKFMRRAVAKDENLRIVSMVRTAENKYYRLGIDDPKELAEGFPKSPEALFAYRGLILGSVEASYFSRGQLELIADFVSRRGGGLLVLGGRRALTQGGYGTTPVADLLPVVLEAGRVDPIHARVSVLPTLAGSGHPIGQIAAPDSDTLAWERLPPLTVLHRIQRTKPGASTLLEGRAPDLAEPLTVLAEQRFGRGRALVLNAQNTWTWQMHQDMPLKDQTHETLWRQLLRWLVRDVPDAVSVRADVEHPSPGEPVAISAEVLDPAFHPRNDADVRLVVNTPIGDRLALPMVWDASEDGVYRVELTPEHAGIYELIVEARTGDEAASARMHLPVGLMVPDHYGAEMREDLLRRIADETGGRFYRAGEVGGLPEEIPISRSGVSVQERLALWDMPIVFLLLIALLAFEWFYRRWRGLV